MKGIAFIQTYALAVNVLREAIRDRMLHFLAGFGILLMLSSIVLGQMAVGGQERVVQNLGFWILGIWGLMAVIYLGSGIIKREIKQKTIYLVLSRPMNRVIFVLGKYVGILFVLLSLFLMLSVALLLLLRFHGIPIQFQHLIAFAFILGEWFLLGGLSLFFASFTSPVLHNFFLVGVTFLGHWSNDLRLFAENAESLFLSRFLMGIYFVLPNLEALNFREYAIYDQDVNMTLIWQAAAVMLFWILTAVTAANIVFARRKLV